MTQPPSAVAIPADYAEGYPKARAYAPEWADKYIAHMHIADPEADELMAELADVDQGHTSRWIAAAMDDPNHSSLRDAPSSLVDFFKGMEPPPDWVDLSEFPPGVRAFHRNAKLVLAAFVLSSVEGFTTNISRSFNLTGRVRDEGVRRLGQNNRFITEVFFPNGMERYGDGWKLSVRLRFIHAQVRSLLNDTHEWDTAAWGIPLSSAHLGYALCTFSVRMLDYMKALGGVFSAEEGQSYVAAWRYAGHLMGVPETILYRDEDEARTLFHTAMLCEPLGTEDAIMLTNGAINSAPLVAGITEPSERQELANYIYVIARGLIGNEIADAMKFPPKGGSRLALPSFRMRERYFRYRNKLLPKYARVSSFDNFQTLLKNSTFDKAGINYRWPDHAYAEESSRW